MKRRSFGLLATTSIFALKAGGAQAAADPSLLTTTLTPTGAERAGNADGSIPAWSGGFTTLPAGWQAGDAYPDFFAVEQPVVVVNASNMDTYADQLSDGVKAMMQKYGYSIKVYPTHRTAAMPQEIYDNIAKNATTASLIAAGGRLGFTGAFGGCPFPIPDASDPLNAGAQIIWNYLVRWSGYAVKASIASYSVSNGQLNLAYTTTQDFLYAYYEKGGSLATFKASSPSVLSVTDLAAGGFSGPPALVGQAIDEWQFTVPYLYPQETWELLNGQGRVRKAPEAEFDTPDSFSNGVCNYDEIFGFNGSPEKYDWKLLGKKEMFIPYNCNAMYLLPADQVHKAHFLDPESVRWERHRCWVVEATLHPGERNVLARRRFYFDEDTWIIGVIDAWDSNNNLYRAQMVYNWLTPDLPGVVYGNNTVHNLQTGDYTSVAGCWNQKARATYVYLDTLPMSDYDPQNLAASGQY